jgi:hypothetical protein
MSELEEVCCKVRQIAERGDCPPYYIYEELMNSIPSIHVIQYLLDVLKKGEHLWKG